MFLSKRNGIYYVFFSNENEKRTCLSTKTKNKSKAMMFLSNFKEELEKRQRQKVIPITFKNFINAFRSYSIANHTYKTAKDYKSVFNRFLEFTGDISLTNITEKMITEYLKGRSNKSLHTSSKDLRYLKCAFGWAATQNYLIKSPCSQIKAITTPEKQPLFLGEVEYQVLINIIDDKDIKHIVIFAVNTGLRLMEILTLEWSQINLKNRYVILDNIKHTTKSKKIRSVALNLNALQILSERQLKNERMVFTIDGSPANPSYVSKTFKKYVIKAQINPDLKFHSLRHTFASWLVQRGVSIYEVSKLLGHSNIKVTEIYAHLKQENLRNAVELLN